MTRLRQRLTAAASACAVGLCTLAASAQAAPGAGAPPAAPPAALTVAPLAAPAPVVVEAVVAAPAPAPAPPANKAAWLRTPAPAPVASAPQTSGVRMFFLGLFVVGLGGAAVYMKRKRKASPLMVNSEVQMLSTARVGSKAQVVVIAVGGRKMLLGVTDAGVNRLAWLDGELEGDELVNVAADQVTPTETENVHTRYPEPRTPERSAGSRNFRDALFGALGQKPSRVRQEHEDERAFGSAAADFFAGADDTASSIAEETRDVVFTRSNPRKTREPVAVAAPAGAPEMIDIEGQARGLVLRLQKRA